MVAKTSILLAFATAALAAPQFFKYENEEVLVSVKGLEEETKPSTQAAVVINVMTGSDDPAVWPNCRKNGEKCKLNVSCCSGYCSWHKGYKCADRDSDKEKESL
ncbi:hypothetical protein H634G_10688 [Metarhizium anisopliae BRIP 53293]|uniref:Uncharacterized protein n=1 Tax=Metarhizium anisopliae BRIP 53293 TaxID=1291518 RepID=A0A0D9NJ15_METAN|nr:hypothetical protein H634G_10688 [Metarhizium anisopliae BRIP 53293]KJK91516.1 hypothetical protein H633G_04614 [Metarhizium anisopliae BRIP 53284]